MAMKKKTNPLITQTEILARAINSVLREIEECRSRCNSLPEAQAGIYFDLSTKELMEKLDALKILYRIETGTAFGD